MSHPTTRSAPKVRSWNHRLGTGNTLEIVASELPSSRVCGDISDVFHAGETSILIGMGDASGHGVAAGMLIVDVRRLLQMMQGSDFSAGEMLTRVNRHICQRYPGSRFVTLTLLVVNQTTGALSFASGGQPFYRLQASGETISCDSDNAPIGILDDEVFPTIELPALEAGESIILISDGFREALNNEGAMYGEPRLFEQFAAGRAEPARVLMDRLHHDVDLHKNGNEDHDDMTVMIVRSLPH